MNIFHKVKSVEDAALVVGGCVVFFLGCVAFLGFASVVLKVAEFLGS